MATLPVTKKEYEYSFLIADFVTKIRKYFDDNKISDFKFMPLINGYEITYNEYIIVIKHRLFGGINIRRYKNGIFEIGKNFSAHSPQDNDVIISDII